MDEESLYKKLSEIKTEDYIWIIYIGIIFLSWYANSLERDFFINKEEKSKNKYRHIIILIFSILVIVYFYFFKDSWDSFKNIDKIDNQKTKDLITLSFIASSLILISGIIFLYIAFKDKNIDIELAFN